MEPVACKPDYLRRFVLGLSTCSAGGPPSGVTASETGSLAWYLTCWHWRYVCARLRCFCKPVASAQAKLLSPLPWEVEGVMDSAGTEWALAAPPTVVIPPKPLQSRASAPVSQSTEGKSGPFKSSGGQEGAPSTSVVQLSDSEMCQPFIRGEEVCQQEI